MKLLALLVTAMLASCSVFKPFTQSVSVRCNEAAASLYVDNVRVGVGTAMLDLSRDRQHDFRAQTEDGRIAVASVSPVWSESATVDLVSGLLFFFPLFGLWSPGAHDLSTTDVILVVPAPPGGTLAPVPEPLKPTGRHGRPTDRRRDHFATTQRP
jgi:hypothetical protein